MSFANHPLWVVCRTMDNLLHDCGTLVAPTAAIVNGFIAVLVAQFFKDHPIAKVLLVVTAALLGVAAIGAIFYSQHQIVTERETAGRRNKEVRARLGEFIQSGNHFMKLAMTPQPRPIPLPLLPQFGRMR